jgi:hypothetical protein
MTTSAAPNTAPGSKSVNSGAMKSNPCGVSRSVDEGDEAHDAAQEAVGHLFLRSRVDEDPGRALGNPCAERAEQRDSERAGDREETVGGQVDQPGEQAAEGLAPDHAPREDCAGAIEPSA